MKSLKRTLCLVLALVMVLGLFGIASATSFTDDNDVQYKEAVDVMTAVGAISGMGDGTFNPKGTITRAQAAKLVTYAILGKAAADRLTGVTSSFTDVTVAGGYAWAIPSIEYLVKEGIINGMGDGTFNPNGEISGIATLKMLLCALGYGVKGEYTGTGWDLQVVLDANKYDLTEGRATNSSALSAAATREEVALYCLNTIQQPLVQYVSSLDVYASKGSLGINLGTIQSNVYTNPALAKEDQTTTPKGIDAMGNPATVWKLGSKPIGAYADTAALTYTTKQTSVAAVAAALKGYSLDAAGIDFTMNGTTGTGDYAKASNQSIQTVAAHIVAASGNGTLIRVYTDNVGKINAITVVKSDLTQVSTVSATSVVLTTVSDTKNNPSYTINATDDLFAKVSGLKKDDYVIVVPKSTAAADVSIPTQITGEWTTKTANGTLTVDGKTYVVAAAATEALISTNVPAGGKNSTLWLDANGFVVHGKNDASAADPHFAYVIDSYQTLVNNQIVGMAKVVFTDGTVADVPAVKSVTTSGGGGSPTTTISAIAATDVNKLYTVTINHDTGLYTLVEATAAAPTSTSGTKAAAPGVVALKKGTAIAATEKVLTDTVTKDSSNNYFNNFYSANVKFIYVNNKTATVVTGVQSVGIPNDTTVDGQTVAAIPCYAAIEQNSATDTEPVVSAVFLPNVPPAGTADMTKTVYVNGTDAVGQQAMLKTDGKYQNVSLYSTYVNGTAQVLPLTTAPATARRFYLMVESTTIPGAYTLQSLPASSTVAPVNDGAITGVLDTSVISIGSASYTITGATVIDARPAADQGTKPITASPAGLAEAYAKYANVNVSILNNPTNNSAIQIYINSVGDPLRTISLASGSNSVKIGNNTYTIAVNKTSAAKTTEVTITVTPPASNASGDTGKNALTFAVKDASNNDVALTCTAGTNWAWTSPALSVAAVQTNFPAAAQTITFTMPDSNVTITVTGGTT